MDSVLVTKPVRTFDLFSEEPDKFLKQPQRAAAHRVVHMPSPIILGHVLAGCNTRQVSKICVLQRTHTECSVDSTLCMFRSPEVRGRMHVTHLGSHGVTPRGEQFGDARRVETSLRQTKGSSKTGTPSTATKRVSWGT